MTTPTDDTKPTVEEKYTRATHASNLKVEAERGGSADVLIAMGWSPSRLGGALIRLHSEWDSCSKPKRMTPAAVELLAASLPRQGDKKNVLDIVGAHRQANDWYMHELKILFGQLKTMPEVRHQLVMWAAKQSIANPEHRVAEILAWWLDPKCPACEGRGKERIAGTPSLSLKPCKVCKGTAERRIPHEQGVDRSMMESKRMLKHIDVCVKTAQTNLKQRLQAYRPQKVG
jgi:hypothetical protein